MRIVGLTHLYPKTGSRVLWGIFIAQLCERLARRHEVKMLIPTAPDHDPQPPQPGKPWVKPFPYLLPRAWSTFGYGTGLTGDQRLSRKSLALAPLYATGATAALWRERRDADVIHAHFLVPNGAIAALVAGGKPLVISLHGSDVYLAERVGWVRRAARLAMDRAAAIIPCSEDLGRRVIAMGADPRKVTVIPYGVDPVVFSGGARAEGRAAVRARLGFGDRPVALFVGNLLPKKGVTHLIDAAPRVLAARPDVAFAIAGEGPLQAELESQAARVGLSPKDFRFFPAVRWSDLPDWYAAADLFVAPSVVDASGNVDGLPNVVLEAMASSLPVVASRVAGIPMAVRPGETGELVPPGDPQALADAILRVLAEPGRAVAMGRAGRAKLEGELTWERIADRYESVFRSLTGAPHAQEARHFA